MLISLTELLLDAFRNDFDGAVVISDDSDLISPIRAIRQLPNPTIDPRTGQQYFKPRSW